MAEIDWAVPDRPIELRPIRSISFSNQAPAAGCQKLYADGKFAELLAQVEVCLPKDAAGDFIAKEERFRRGALSPGQPGGEYAGDEQAKASQEIRDVLGWLMGYVGAKVEDLTPKTKLQSYCEHDYEGFLAVLKKNRKKLALDPARREPWPRAEFEGSLRQIGPLWERTDGLIDG